MQKGQKYIQILLGPSEKNSFLSKTTKNVRYVRFLGKKPHFAAYTEAKRRVARG